MLNYSTYIFLTFVLISLFSIISFLLSNTITIIMIFNDNNHIKILKHKKAKNYWSWAIYVQVALEFWNI